MSGIGLSIYDNQHPGTLQTRSTWPVWMAGKARCSGKKTMQAVIYLFLFYLIIYFISFKRKYVYEVRVQACRGKSVVR